MNSAETPEPTEAPELPRTIIGVPGQWPSRSEIVTRIARSSGGYLFAGSVLMHLDTKAQFELEVYDRDDELATAFAAAGTGRLSNQELQEIADHTFCLYLVGAGGTTAAARRFMTAANALLNCGGLAVKIESAGTAHSVAGWRTLCADYSRPSMLKAFVTYVGTTGHYYSCGMHNLGYPDCVVEAQIDAPTAANLIDTFLRFLLLEDPTLNSGETFSIAANAPHYRIFAEECTEFDAEDSFHNPFGIWKMVPA